MAELHGKKSCSGHETALAFPRREASPAQLDDMIRAAIIGLGRWGRSLVTSMQDNSDDIRFVLGHTRTRAKAEDFCRDRGVRLVDDFDTIPPDPDIEAVVLATPHSQHAEQIKQAGASMSGSARIVSKSSTRRTPL